MPCPQLRIALFFESLKMAHGHDLFLLYLGERQKPRGKFVKAFFWENTCALCPWFLNPGIIRIEKPAFLYSNIYSAKPLEYPRKISTTSQQKKYILAYDNKLQHNYDVTNFKSKYSN